MLLVEAVGEPLVLRILLVELAFHHHVFLLLLAIHRLPSSVVGNSMRLSQFATLALPDRVARVSSVHVVVLDVDVAYQESWIVGPAGLV